MPTQLPRVPSLIPSSFATLAIGRDVSITIFTASSLNSGEKLFLGRGNYFTFPDGPSYWMDCPEGSGHLICRPADYADVCAERLFSGGERLRSAGIIRGLRGRRGGCRRGDSGRAWCWVAGRGRWRAPCGSCRRVCKCLLW